MKNNTEIQLPVSELKSILPGISKVITRRPSLPVLGCVRVESNPQGQVSIQATDLDDFASVRIQSAVSSDRPGAFLVPWEPFSKLIKSTSGEENIILIDEGEEGVKLRTFIGNSPIDKKVDSVDLKEWPSVPVVTEPGIVASPELREAVRQAFDWASEEESRLILNSAYLDVSDKKGHYVVSTNGRALFSANSFSLDLKESLIIPTRKFLGWSGVWEEEMCRIAYQPGKEDEKTKVREAGWVQFKTNHWTFTTRQIQGLYPNWKQVVPTPTQNWTTIKLSDPSIKQALQVISKLPGDYAMDYPVRLRIDQNRLKLEGRNKEDKEWTSIVVQEGNITGKPITVALNRHYLVRALKLGLNSVEIQDALSPLVFTNLGKKVIIMPVSLEGPKPTPVPAPASSDTPAPTAEQTPSTSAQPETSTPTNNERTEMSKATTTTEIQAPESAIKSVVQQIEKIKDTLRDVISDFNEVIASLKTAEKEKKASDKEIESIRSTLRTIQNVKI